MGLFAGIGGLLGGIAGAQKKPGLSAETEIEQSAKESNQQIFSQLRGLIQQGPGAGDVSAAVNAQRSFATQLAGLAESGGLPSQGDITQTRGLADLLFAGQREGLAQSFEQQDIQAGRRAALSGRSSTDPVLANQLAQSQIRQQRLLGAEQGSFATNLALQLPGQRLGFSRERVGVLQGLSNQALQGRQGLFQLGRGVQQQEFQNRVQQQRIEASRGGGFGGFLSGALGGAGAGLSVGSGIQRLQGQGAFQQARIGALNRLGTQPINLGNQFIGASPALSPFSPQLGNLGQFQQATSVDAVNAPGALDQFISNFRQFQQSVPNQLNASGSQVLSLPRGQTGLR